MSSQASAVLHIMQKRHACRQFDPRPVPKEILDKVVYAAHRAPTAGNAPYRFVVVVSDQTLLRMIRLVSPGFFGDCSVAIFICTDMDAAKRSGRDVLDEITRIDAGAAAENVILAAYSLGLAGSFIRSYSESAVSKLLRLPESCRTELLVSIGYPDRNEQKPLRKKRGATVTYADRFGQPWASSRSGS